MAIGYKEQTALSVPTPAVGETYTFIDSADGQLKRMDDTRTVTPIESTGSTPPASSVSFVPSGNIIATNVQDAIEELDAEKAPIGHVGSTGVFQHGVASGVVAGFLSPSDFTKLSALNRGVPNGLAELDGSGRLPVSQLPVGIQGGLNLQGLWNANTNSPVLTSSVGTKGFYYVVSVAGDTNLDGITDWKPNDWAIFNGLTWQKLDDSETIVSVNGQTGVVVLNKSDIGLSNVDNTSDLNKPISTATQSALNSKENAGVAITQLTGEVAAGPGGGSQISTVSNAAVIAKLLTGFAVDWNIITASDSLLSAIQKLAGRASLSLNQVSSNVVVPTGYTWLRQNRTAFSGSTKITIQSGGKITFLN